MMVYKANCNADVNTSAHTRSKRVEIYPPRLLDGCQSYQIKILGWENVWLISQIIQKYEYTGFTLNITNVFSRPEKYCQRPSQKHNSIMIFVIIFFCLLSW